MILEGYFSKLNEDQPIRLDEKKDTIRLITEIDNYLNEHYHYNTSISDELKKRLILARRSLEEHLYVLNHNNSGVKESYDDKETWNTDYEPEFKYTITYEGALFEGDSDGYNEHYTDSWNECVSLLNAYGDDVRIRIYDNKYNAVYDSLEKMWESKNKKKTGKTLKESYNRITVDDLDQIKETIEELIDELDYNGITEIRPESNTYGIGVPFIGTYEGYIDLGNWGKYAHESKEDEYDESFNDKKINKRKLKESFSSRNLIKAGFERWVEKDFEDDGSKFKMYKYKEMPVTYLKSNGEIYLSAAPHELNKMTPKEYMKLPHYRDAVWKFNGISEDAVNLEEFKKALEAFSNEYFNNNLKEGLSEIEYLTDEGYEELKQLVKKFYPRYKTVREFVDNYDRDKIEVIGVEQLDEIPDYENAFEIDSWDMSQGTGNVIARVFLATNGKLYGYADF